MRSLGWHSARLSLALLVLALGPWSVFGAQPNRPTSRKEERMTLTLRSTAFGPRGDIPSRHTCDAEDLSPPLAWSGAPEGTKSFALILDDPDAPDPSAPKMIWVHWVLYDIPATTASLPAGLTTRALPTGTREGVNDWRKTGYRGPCPPIGKHRYVHTLYALDTVLPDLHRPDKRAVEKAMEGHVLARAELVGLYQKR